MGFDHEHRAPSPIDEFADQVRGYCRWREGESLGLHGLYAARQDD